MDRPQAYLHEVCKLHYEKIKQNKFQRNSPLNPCTRVSQEKTSKSSQKFSETSVEVFLHLQDVISFPTQLTTRQSEFYRFQKL